MSYQIPFFGCTNDLSVQLMAVRIIMQYAILLLSVLLSSQAFGNTYFEQIMDLYNSGTAAAADTFQQGMNFDGQSVHFDQPNALLVVKIVAIDVRHPELGDVKVASVFDGRTKDEVAVQKMRSGKVTPLIKDEAKNALSNETVAEESTCSHRRYFRQNKLPDGTEVLLVQTYGSDPRPRCNPNANGGRNGQLLAVGYFELPR